MAYRALRQTAESTTWPVPDCMPPGGERVHVSSIVGVWDLTHLQCGRPHTLPRIPPFFDTDSTTRAYHYVYTSTWSTPTVTAPSAPTIDRVEAVFNSEVRWTHHGNYTCYLVTWQGRDFSHHSWISVEELRRQRPDLYQAAQETPTAKSPAETESD